MFDGENFNFDIDKYESVVNRTDSIKSFGSVTRITEMTVEADGPEVMMGEICRIIPRNTSIGIDNIADLFSENPQGAKELSEEQRGILAEVVGIEQDKIILMCYSEMKGLHLGDKVIAMGETLSVYVGEHLLGRIVDGVGKDYDGLGDIGSTHYYSVFRNAPDAASRKLITEPLVTGIKAIDGMLTLGKGQRIGVFAGAGVGKSTLLGMIARHMKADVNVIALIGERGRELMPFIKDELGEEGMRRSVVVYSGSDQNALYKVRAAYTATTIAEYFRDQGKDVILMMDNLTRFAMAQREIGLSVGEPPAQKGYPPSVFKELPKILERAGTNEKGSITGIYAVLLEDDFNDPIGEAVRSIVDGHIYLSKKFAHANHYPAIDILSSISRVANKVISKEQRSCVSQIRDLMAEYNDKEEMITIGMYVRGSNPKTDLAIDMHEAIEHFLTQNVDEGYTFDETLNEMASLFGGGSGGENGESDEDVLGDIFG
ncbi:MAG: FliI/YscN family ATPase [Spirochaetales bacterium]|nr:FliI/YscN family ATPase [Spirochaetales bacterium]